MSLDTQSENASINKPEVFQDQSSDNYNSKICNGTKSYCKVKSDVNLLEKIEISSKSSFSDLQKANSRYSFSFESKDLISYGSKVIQTNNFCSSLTYTKKVSLRADVRNKAMLRSLKKATTIDFCKFTNRSLGSFRKKKDCFFNELQNFILTKY